MRKLLSIAVAVAMCAVAGLVTVSVTSAVAAEKEQDEAKYTVKQVMKQAHGKKLLQKVLSGEASKEEKDKLLDLYISLVENKPKKGDEQEWLMKSGRLIVAAAMVSVGREGGEAELKKASNCKACHSAHK